MRRASITVVAGMLQKAELIRYSRGQMTLLERPGLEEGKPLIHGMLALKLNVPRN